MNIVRLRVRGKLFQIMGELPFFKVLDFMGELPSFKQLDFMGELPFFKVLDFMGELPSFKALDFVEPLQVLGGRVHHLLLSCHSLAGNFRLQHHPIYCLELPELWAWVEPPPGI